MEFEEFRDQYELMHPGGAPQAPEGVNSGRWLRLGIGAMFICSAGISGVHTVPTIYSTIEGAYVSEFVRQVVSAGAFVAVELGIAIIGYGDEHTRKDQLMAGLGLAVAITANVVSISRAINSQSLPDLAVAIILGVFAPLMALLSGERLKGEQHRVANALDEQRAAYKAERVAWDEQIVAAWERLQRIEQKRLSKPVPAVHEAIHEKDVSREDFTNIHEKTPENKPRVKIHEVVARVRENGDHGLSTTEMMEKYGISAGATSTIRKQLMNGNGHSGV